MDEVYIIEYYIAVKDKTKYISIYIWNENNPFENKFEITEDINCAIKFKTFGKVFRMLENIKEHYSYGLAENDKFQIKLFSKKYTKFTRFEIMEI